MADDVDDSIWIPRQRKAADEFDRLREEFRSSASTLSIPSSGDVVADRYEVVREIGRGGFGCVLEVVHRKLGHRFAMKLMSPEVAEQPGWAERFREEAKATSQLTSQHIVFVTDFGECRRHGAYIVMEYLEGESLREILRREGAQSVDTVLGLVRATSSALASVHEIGIVHCDLKPENIFRAATSSGELWKLLDFGTSSIVMSAAETQSLYGTPKYMAPEHAMGEEVDGRADIFSLGVVVYRMLTARLPWITRRWLQATPRYRRENPPRPPGELRDALPSSLDDVVMRAIAVEPDSRFESVQEFARAFANAVESTARAKPILDPTDVRTTSGGEVSHTSSAPSVRIRSTVSSDFGSSESDDRPIVEIVFHSRDRLEREYRRNMVVGGLFVPTDETLPVDTPVEVVLRLRGRDTKCRADGRIVQRSGSATQESGFGISLDPKARQKIAQWVKGTEDPIDPDAILTSGGAARIRGSLSPGEMFVMSRLEVGMTYRELADICVGVSFDLPTTIRSMVQRGYLEMSHERPTRMGPRLTRGGGDIVVPSDTDDSDALDLAALFERIDFMTARRNYLGALETLRGAIETWPRVAALRFRHARLLHEFGGDDGRVLDAAQRALELEPSNREYRQFVRSLEGS